MEDFSDKIAELLNDPEGMQKIKSIAGEFMNSAPTTENHEEASAGGLDMSQMAGLVKIASAFNSQGKDDDNSRLLAALKPHLSDERQKKVDKAVGIMRMIKLLPLLKESGLGSILG